ncbi:MAG: hypothetical protein RLZZ628_3037 [Bacteroidota bacterium]|jgi:uncharacterized protein YqeY
MTFPEKINHDLKEAMKAKNEVALRTVRAIKAEISLFNTDEKTRGTELTEDKAISLVQKMVKKRKDSLGIYEKQNRADLATIEKAEIEILENYLPKALTANELEAFLKALITEVGATSAKDMGKVIGAANKKLAGKAEGAVISAAVKKLLTV